MEVVEHGAKLNNINKIAENHGLRIAILNRHVCSGQTVSDNSPKNVPVFRELLISLMGIMVHRALINIMWPPIF